MQDWPADKVARWPIERLKVYAQNARVHSVEQITQIANSITEWGFTMPVLVDEAGTLIAGHARVLAAKKLKLTEIPVVMARGWTDAQIRAYRLADNKLAMNATWADDLLKLEFSDLKLEGFDLTLLGWDHSAIDGLFTERTKGLTDPDNVPASPSEPRCEAGDVWTLGNHTLYCDDCLEVLPILDVQDASVVTDPPYGIGFQYDKHDDTPEGYGDWIWRCIFEAELRCAPGAPLFVWQSPKNVRSFPMWFPRPWQLFVGARNFVNMTPGAVMYHAYDAVLVWWKPGAEPWTSRTNNRDWHLADTASQVAKPDNIQRRHPCPRPADQVQHIIEQWVPLGSTILEPFSGSGTTIIAAEITGRRCVAIEISPAYCDIAIERWEQFTGREAVRHVK